MTSQIEHVQIGFEAACLQAARSLYGASSPREDTISLRYRILAGPDRGQTRWVDLSEEKLWDLAWRLDLNLNPEDYSVWEALQRFIDWHATALLSVQNERLYALTEMAAYFECAIRREYIHYGRGCHWWGSSSVRMVDVDPTHIICCVTDDAEQPAFDHQAVFADESIRLTVRHNDGIVRDVLLTGQNRNNFLSLNLFPAETMCKGNGSRDIRIHLSFLQDMIVSIPQSVMTAECV